MYQTTEEDRSCLLCSEQITHYALGECNHKYICIVCTIKMREKCKDNTCPLCKQILLKVIITNDFDAEYSKFDLRKLANQRDLYFQSDVQRFAVESLNQLKCIEPRCKDIASFPTLMVLKKHLKEIHGKFLCEICLEYRTCVLSEQILYSYQKLQRHINIGDYDEDGNIVSYHPYCRFCNKNFYDDDKFKQHLNNAHLICELCGPDYKLTYYKDHQSFERHQTLSHYICEIKECREVLKAFTTLAELEHHKFIQHNIGTAKQVKAVNSLSLTGFYEQQDHQIHRSKLNDKEGSDFSDQFIQFKKMRLRGLVEVDNHQDEKIDLREFYSIDYNDYIDEQLDREQGIYGDQDYEEEYKYGDNQGQSRGGRRNGKDNNYKNQAPQYRAKDNQPEKECFLEEIKIYKNHSVPQLKSDQILRKLLKFTESSKKSSIKDLHFDLLHSKIQPASFAGQVFEIIGPKPAFRIFNLYVNSRELTEQRSKELDDAISKLLQKIPRRKLSLVNISATYSELFKQFLEQLEINFLERIRTSKLNINKRKEISTDKERIFQLTEVLRHVRTQEMGKLKFVVNFGLSINSLELVRNIIFMEDLEGIQKYLLKIPNKELLALYLYTSLCVQILKGEKIHKEKSQINKYILSDMFVRYGDFIAKFKDESSESSEEEIKLPAKSTVTAGNKQKTKQNAPLKQEAPKIEISKYEFPSLPTPEVQTFKPALNVKEKQSVWNNLTSAQFVGGENQKQIKKQLEKEFPSLSSVQQQPPQPKKPPPPKSVQYIPDDSFEPLPNSNIVQQQQQVVKKIEEEPISYEKKLEKEQEIGVLKKKGKKKEKVFLAGGFK